MGKPKELLYIVSYRSHKDYKYIHKYQNDYESYYPQNAFAYMWEHHKSYRLANT